MTFGRRKFLAFATLLAASNTASALIPLNSEHADAVEATLKPQCTLTEALTAMAHNNAQYVAVLNRAIGECENAEGKLEVIMKTERIGGQNLRNPKSIAKGLSDILGKDDAPSAPTKVRDLAEFMKNLVTTNKGTFKRLATAPADVTDDEYVGLLKNLAAITLINSTFLGFPGA
jgi:hypothetical protein